MEINRHNHDGGTTLTLRGRLDAAWSDPVSDALQQVLREGVLEIRLDLAAVSYISSAGLRVLLSQWKELRRAKGRLAITAVSAEVERILKLAGLSVLLEVKATATTGTTETPFTASPATARQRTWNGPGFTGEIDELSATARWRGQLILSAGKSAEASSQLFKLPQPTLALGLGAFGESSADSALRLGEFLAVGGNAVCLPTDEMNRPDYAVSEGQMAPEAWVMDGLVAEGAFSHLVRFEAAADANGVKLSDLVASMLTSAGDKPIAFAAVLESVALVGAYRRKPATGEPTNAFAFPAIRDWLTFTAEPAYQNTVALLVGVASRDKNPALAAFTRPCGAAGSPQAHIHATVFPYRPVRYGHLELGETLDSLFDSKRIITVLHLLADLRPDIGAGESRFYRGACWFSPLDIS